MILKNYESTFHWMHEFPLRSMHLEGQSLDYFGISKKRRPQIFGKRDVLEAIVNKNRSCTGWRCLSIAGHVFIRMPLRTVHISHSLSSIADETFVLFQPSRNTKK